MRRWTVVLSFTFILTAALAASAAAQKGPPPCAGSPLYLEGPAVPHPIGHHCRRICTWIAPHLEQPSCDHLANSLS